jgi:hypothetical protein
MTNTHPDQSPTISNRWRTPLLVFSTAMTAVLTIVSAALAWAWSDAGWWSVAALWCVFVAELTITVIFAAELFGPRWGWSEAVIEQTRGLCGILAVVAALSALGFMNPDLWDWTKMYAWGWLGVFDWAVSIIGIALGIRTIIRARQRMRANGASHA